MLPDTSASLLLGYSAFAYIDANGNSASTGYLYSDGIGTANVVLAVTAGGSPAFGCPDSTGTVSDIDNAAEMHGRIALVSRGQCAFIYKVANAKLAGAVGILIYNPSDRDPDTIGGMSGGEEGLDLYIPAMQLPWAIAEPIFNVLSGGDAVSATMKYTRL